MVILTGTVWDKQQIPLPPGYSQEECTWFVSFQDGDTGGTRANGHIHCSVDSNRIVTSYWWCDNGYNSIPANYVIIGIKR